MKHFLVSYTIVIKGYTERTCTLISISNEHIIDAIDQLFSEYYEGLTTSDKGSYYQFNNEFEIKRISWGEITNQEFITLRKYL